MGHECVCVCAYERNLSIHCMQHSLMFQTSHSSSTLLEQQTNHCTHYYFKFKSSSDQELKWHMNIPPKTWDQMKTMSLLSSLSPMHTSSTNKYTYIISLDGRPFHPSILSSVLPSIHPSSSSRKKMMMGDFIIMSEGHRYPLIII